MTEKRVNRDRVSATASKNIHSSDPTPVKKRLDGAD